jgi:chemotaxis protein MotA
MDRGTFLGFLLGLTILAVTISTGANPKIFLHMPSLLVVIGGVTASTLIRFPLNNVTSAFGVASRAFFTHPAVPHQIVLQLVGLSQRARREGLKTLEKHLPPDRFLAKGLQMAIDRIDRERIREVLGAQILATQERHGVGQEIFKFIAISAPSFGMVGTLIGMVQLFATLRDPAQLGGAMSLSLLSTLWGAVVAYLFAIPISGKLEHRSREEAQAKQLMLEGILGIAAESHPGQLEEHLNAFLSPRARVRRHAGGLP